jgi:hypothetical protein
LFLRRMNVLSTEGRIPSIDITLVGLALALILHHNVTGGGYPGGTFVECSYSYGLPTPLASLCMSIVVRLQTFPPLGDDYQELEYGYACGWAAGCRAYGLFR